MHPSSLLSYYPTYAILDEILSKNNYKKLSIYIDLKNTLQTVYMEHAIVNILEQSKKASKVDTSIFSSLVSFLTFHKIYGLKRGIDVDFVVFFESGHSIYHKNISKTYKISRRIDDLYGLDRADKDLFFKILHANFQLIEKAFNKIPNAKVVRLNKLEADFVPYYLLSRNIVDYGNSIAHVVYSNDHDMWQCVSDHSYIFSKSGKSKKIVKKGDVMELMLKKPNNIPDVFLPLAMAIIGDPGDDVEGVKGIGPSRFLKMFPELVEMTGNMGVIYEKVRKGQDLFDPVPTHFKNKYMRDVVESEIESKKISNNLKLVSFELISREVDDPSSLEMSNRRDQIIETVNRTESTSIDAMKKALDMSGVYLEEGSIDFLYI
jgi:hypothetical protein